MARSQRRSLEHRWTYGLTADLTLIMATRLANHHIAHPNARLGGQRVCTAFAAERLGS